MLQSSSDALSQPFSYSRFVYEGETSWYVVCNDHHSNFNSHWLQWNDRIIYFDLVFNGIGIVELELTIVWFCLSNTRTILFLPPVYFDWFFQFHFFSRLDQILLQTLISNTPAYRTSEGWLPICITDVQDNAFLHLYVGFITDEMYVFFVTTGKDPDLFEQYSQLKDRIYSVGVAIEWGVWLIREWWC